MPDYAVEYRITLAPKTQSEAAEDVYRIDAALADILKKLDAKIVDSEVYTY